MKRIQNYLIYPSILLIIYFLYRVIDYAKIMFYHPLSNIKHDFPGYLVQLFALDVCGLYKLCPYWYNGFMTFIGSPPGWYLFSYPYYLLTGSAQITFYTSLVTTLILSFIVIIFLGKKLLKLNFVSCFFIFAFFFGSNTMIHTIRIGRPHEIFAWLNFIIVCLIILYYKNRAFDNRFFVIIPSYALALLTYHSVGILIAPVILGLFLIKDKMGKIIILKIMFITFLMTLFWLIPLTLNSSYTSLWSPNVRSETLWTVNGFFHFTPIAIILYPLALFFILYFYIKQQNNPKKELLFFSPLILVAVLFLFGVHSFIPLLNSIFTNIYLLFIIFFMLILLAKLKTINKLFDIIILTSIFIAALLFVTTSFINNPLFDKPTPEQSDIASLFSDVHGKYEVFLNSPRSSKAYYSYGVLYYNLTTIRGNYPSMASFDYLKKLDLLNEKFVNHDCKPFITLSKELNLEYFITDNQECSILAECGLTLKKQKNKACLYVN